MPPAANDNQGLKIAVAVFVTLSVILAVSTYFGFSEASKNAEARAKAETDARTADTRKGEALSLALKLQDLAGYAKDDATVVPKKIEDDRKKVDTQIQELTGKVQQVFAAFKG